MNDEWKNARYTYPPDGVVVDTKIDDEKGRRNEQPMFKRGNLWWVRDGSMYVYYSPTHWRYRQQQEAVAQ